MLYFASFADFLDKILNEEVVEGDASDRHDFIRYICTYKVLVSSLFRSARLSGPLYNRGRPLVKLMTDRLETP